MVNEIAILDTVFRDHRPFRIGSIAHSKNVLWTDVIFCHAPPKFLGLVNRIRMMSLDQNGFAAVFCVNLQHCELLAVHVVVGGKRTHLDSHKIADIESGQVFAVELGAFTQGWMIYIREFLDVVTDVLRSHVIKFVRGQVIVSSEITVHIYLQTPAHRDIPQIVFATRNRNLRVFNVDQ